MLKVDSLVKSFGALLATDNLSFQVKKGEIHAIIGPKNSRGYSVIPERNSSKNRKATAPMTGPKSVPNPPKTVMMINSPDVVQCITDGLTNSVWLADKTPAIPQIVPAITKATS